MAALCTQNIPENDALVFINFPSVKPKQAGQPREQYPPNILIINGECFTICKVLSHTLFHFNPYSIPAR